MITDALLKSSCDALLHHGAHSRTWNLTEFLHGLTRGVGVKKFALCGGVGALNPMATQDGDTETYAVPD